jgi:hypothetical protein
MPTVRTQISVCTLENQKGAKENFRRQTGSGMSAEQQLENMQTVAGFS